MAIAFTDSVNNYAASATSISAVHSFAVGDLLIGVYAFQGVGPTSGPWGDPNVGQYAADHIGPASGWLRVGWTAPSATGVGIEVWAAINHTTSPGGRILAFTGTYTCQVVMASYSGTYAPNGTINDGAVRVCTTAQVVGNAPAAPSVSVNAGEQIIAVGGDLMTAAKFGTPAGYTSRLDVAGGGAGNVEATIADVAATAAGNTGLITFPNAAASSSTAGTTATLAVVPAPSTAGVGAVVVAGMPEDLDLPDGYVLTWAALDPTTGADVAGVTVTDVSIFGTMLGSGSGGGVDLGPFMLVPGPAA